MLVDIVNDRDQRMDDVVNNWHWPQVKNKVDDDEDQSSKVVVVVVVDLLEDQTVPMGNRMLQAFDTFDWHYENNDDDDIANGMN